MKSLRLYTLHFTFQKIAKRCNIISVKNTEIRDMIEFKRKIYNKLVQWKESSNGSSALLIEGARRIGKSHIATLFAQNEYDSYNKTTN